jgi:osmoprotectant transport system ATP-binding protein
MIEFENVSKHYDGRPVVGGVSFRVPAGRLCAVIGASGSGKSTLLKLVNRLIDRDTGIVRVDGQDVAAQPVEALRRKIGYVIQSVGLFPHWTVEQNIAAVPRLLHWSDDRIRARIEELLDLVRLDAAAVRGRLPDELSGGQQQRVGVARALAADPSVLLMDEPFGALDPVTRAALQDELARIQATARKTILFVTHDMDEALRLADCLAVVEQGRLVQFGAPREVIDHPASDLVRDLVGRSDLGLKRLAVRRVGEHASAARAGSGAPIAASASLRDALSEMLARGADVLPVCDAGGAITGSIRLSDVVRP